MSDYYTQPSKLLSVFKYLPGAYLLLSSELIIEAVSDAYLVETQTKPENLLGRYLFEVFPDNALSLKAPGKNNLLASLNIVLATGLPHEIARNQYDLPDPENPAQFTEYHWLIQNTPVLDEQGKVVQIIHAVVNITKSIQAERFLQQSQQREKQARFQADEREAFYQIFEHTPAAICIQRGPEHRYEYFNAAYQQFFPDRQLQGRPVAEALPETVTAGFVALLDGVYQTGETYFGHESRLLLEQPCGKPPKEMYFTFTYQAYHEKGQVVGISTFAYEVTEQVLLRRQRDAQQQQLRDLFEQAPVAIAVFQGPEYMIEVVNPFMAALTSRPPDQVLGKPLLKVLPQVRRQGILDILNNVVATRSAFVAREVPARLPRQGQIEPVYLDFVFQPLQDEYGHITRVAAVATDVSEQVAARQQLDQANQELSGKIRELDLANQQLTHTNKDLDNFIYTASHDLKTPILNIEGLMVALLEQLSPEILQAADVQRTTALIFDSVQRFKRTIHHLTDITKLQKENRLEALSINLSALIAEVQLDLAPALQEANGRIDVDVASCPSICFSEKNLRSILYNLISNAIKYHSPERTPLVRITCQNTGEYEVLSVQDNGLGINVAQEHKLFAMFSRLHDHVEGSGIGLYMVKKIIENAGGKIEVQSKEGEGSTFKVYFPRIP